MLGFVEVMQNSTARTDRNIQSFDTVSFEGICLKVLYQRIVTAIVGKCPVIQSKNIQAFANNVDQRLPFAFLEQNFIRFKILNETLYISDTSLSDKKFPRRNIYE